MNDLVEQMLDACNPSADGDDWRSYCKEDQDSFRKGMTAAAKVLLDAALGEMGANETYVRSKWEDARFASCYEESMSWPNRPLVALPKNRGRVLAKRPNGGHWILSGNINTMFELSHTLTEPEAWQAAADFTRQREEEIRQVKEEIAFIANLGFHIKQDGEQGVAIRRRILARLEAVLADLTKGFKP